MTLLCLPHHLPRHGSIRVPARPAHITGLALRMLFKPAPLGLFTSESQKQTQRLLNSFCEQTVSAVTGSDMTAVLLEIEEEMEKSFQEARSRSPDGTGFGHQVTQGVGPQVCWLSTKLTHPQTIEARFDQRGVSPAGGAVSQPAHHLGSLGNIATFPFAFRRLRGSPAFGFLVF